jgi:hypothetical protein
MMLTPHDVPILLAPASIIAKAHSKSCMPPDALTPMLSPTVRRINKISSTVAPAVPRPVDDLTKSTPVSLQTSHACLDLMFVRQVASCLPAE